MDNITQQESYTTEQLISYMKRNRKMMEEDFKDCILPVTAGKEMILETEAGSVRVLAYNMEKTGKLPVFVNLHGGGFVIGKAEVDDAFMPDIAEKANIRIINVDYSLAPENPFPRALEEIYAVLKYLKQYADELGIDPNRIAIGGHSAGGNFTASICLMNNERKEVLIQCAILDYPPLDIYTDGSKRPQVENGISYEVSRIFDACYHNVKEERKNPLISPLLASDEQLKHFPPALIITAENDSLCNEAELFWKRLVKVGVEAEYKCFKGCPHGFTHQNVPEAKVAWMMMISFLKDNLWKSNIT